MFALRLHWSFPYPSSHRHTMWMLSIALWILSVLEPMHGYDFGLDRYRGVQDTEAGSDGQSRLGMVSSVEELVEVLYPDYSTVHRCLRGKAYKGVLGRPPREATSSRKGDETIKVITEEIQRTICKPREVCLEVSKEYPERTDRFFVPLCVAVYRCGGCCNNEGQYCTNTSYSHIQKTLLELSPMKQEQSVNTLAFVNHTACECRPKHSIIRRATTTHLNLCSPPDVPCGPGLVWDPNGCKCVSEDTNSLTARELGPLGAALLALCGPNKILVRKDCQCTCQNGLTETSCGPGRQLDAVSCRCTCLSHPTSGACPPGQCWDSELCECVWHSNCLSGR